MYICIYVFIYDVTVIFIMQSLAHSYQLTNEEPKPKLAYNQINPLTDYSLNYILLLFNFFILTNYFFY